MLTLVVPGLIWPRQALADLTGDMALPSLRLLLGRGRVSARPATADIACLAAELGDIDPQPAAALRRLACGHTADDADWMCLDPVRLRFEERNLVLDDPQRLGLDAVEAGEFAVSLAPTFAGLGELECLSPLAWNLRLHAPAPRFPAPATSIGRAVAPLPAGQEYKLWRQALNEAQMVLHAHPRNQAREAAGRPVVNSVWPWGSGPLPASSKPTGQNIWSNELLVRGMARHQGAGAELLPPALGDTAGGLRLVHFDALAAPARLGDAMAWREALERLESAWLAPALSALRDGGLAGLRMIAPGEHNSVELRVARSDLWKVWRKPRAVAEAFVESTPA